MGAISSHHCGLGSIPTQCHTWVEFLVGSCPAPRLFLRVPRFSTCHKNQHLQIPIRIEDKHKKQLRLMWFPFWFVRRRRRSICFNLGQFDFFICFWGKQKILLAPLIFSSCSFFSSSPLYLPHLLFPPCSPNIPVLLC